MALYHMNNFPKIIKVLPKKPQASTAVRDITPIYATASISLKNKFNPGCTNQNGCCPTYSKLGVRGALTEMEKYHRSKISFSLPYSMANTSHNTGYQS